MTIPTVYAWELMIERPEMVKSITDLIVADSIATLVETDDSYSHLLTLFIRSGEDIVENYKSAKQGIDISSEYHTLYSLVEQVIDNIGSDLFIDMLDTDENSTYSEVLRCFGHGVSFWDNNYYEDFGFTETPRLKTTLEHPYDISTQILDKIAEAHPEYKPDEEEENTDFDQWLAENYSPAGENASNGEQWYLSVSPYEFMPVSLSTLKQQWEKDNPTEDDKEYHLVVVDNVTGETIYHKELVGEDSLDIDYYLPEIQDKTGISLAFSPTAPSGYGQICITIGFSATPENDSVVWDAQEYYLAIP